MELNETHDPALVAFTGAHPDFPIQNLPCGIFAPKDDPAAARGGVAIGDDIVDLACLAASGILDGAAAQAAAVCTGPVLNPLFELGPTHWQALRLALSRALRAGSSQEAALRRCLVPQADAVMKLPCTIGDFTDFYSSINHATAVGRLFRPDNPLLPNYRWVPVAYHGRSSSIVVSPQAFPRPRGQVMAPDASAPTLQPSRRLDYELELGVVIGNGNALGNAIPIGRAAEHVFGLCVLNDWSARDIQAWEYQPLGPFLAKNFASTVSPWLVTLEALAPFRVPFMRAPDEPAPLDYLDDAADRAAGALDIQLEVALETATPSTTRLSQSSYRHAYWTVAQLVAHHTVNGCNLRSGDLLGTGTQSGPGPGEAGSLIELCEGGKKPLRLAGGEERTFLEDGDTVVMRAWCEAPGAVRIGFGEARALVLPAAD